VPVITFIATTRTILKIRIDNKDYHLYRSKWILITAWIIGAIIEVPVYMVAVYVPVSDGGLPFNIATVYALAIAVLFGFCYSIAIIGSINE
jgi:uncharacterized membrane-anchored protein